MKVTELMNSPVTVSQEDTLLTAAGRMRDDSVGCLVATHGAEPVGILTDRDIATRCTAEGHDPRACTVGQHMTAKLTTARPDTDALDALHLMVAHKVKRLPVVDGGRLVGLVSLSDIAEALETPMLDLLAGMGAARRSEPTGLLAG